MISPGGVTDGTVTSNRIGADGPDCHVSTLSCSVISCAGTTNSRKTNSPLDLCSAFQKPSPKVYLYCIYAPTGRLSVVKYRPSGWRVMMGIRSAFVLKPPCKSANVLPNCKRLPATRTGAPGKVFVGVDTTNVTLTNGAGFTRKSTVVVCPAPTVAPC